MDQHTPVTPHLKPSSHAVLTHIARNKCTKDQVHPATIGCRCSRSNVGPAILGRDSRWPTGYFCVTIQRRVLMDHLWPKHETLVDQNYSSRRGSSVKDCTGASRWCRYCRTGCRKSFARRSPLLSAPGDWHVILDRLGAGADIAGTWLESECEDQEKTSLYQVLRRVCRSKTVKA